MTRLYTRVGDEGETHLADGSRVGKVSLRIDVIGDIDELNASLGMAEACCEMAEIGHEITWLQHRLFDLGAELAQPDHPRFTENDVLELEIRIDRIDAELPPVREFILPGGGQLAAQLHFARAVCRRAERNLWRLAERERSNPETLKFLNRLSDLLFVLARKAAREETPWNKAQ